MPDRLTAAVGGRRVVVVSPHLDDGVLSAYGLLTHVDDPELLTVFSGPASDGIASEWDRRLGFDSSVEAMQFRLDEDRRAAELVGATTAYLDLRELAYREPAEEPAVRDALRAALSEHVDGDNDVVLVVPGGTGSTASRWRRLRHRLANRFPLPGLRGVFGKAHPDHVLVYQVAFEVALDRCPAVVVYEDLPYAYSGGTQHLRALSKRADLDVTRHTWPVDLAAKERAVRCYGSQIATLLPPWAKKFSDGFQPRERYWLVTRRI